MVDKTVSVSIDEISDEILKELENIENIISGDLKAQVRRHKIVNELYTTEQNYVNSLTVVNEHFIDPLKEFKKNILSLDDQKRIFANWKSILSFHVELLASIEKRLNSWNEYQLIGNIFDSTKLSLQNLTNIYKFFINNYDRSMAVLDYQKKNNKEFKKFVDTNTALYLQGMDLGSYLITPVQRIPRYVLLFDSLLKSTKPYHPDYQNLEKCLEELKAVANFINLSKENAEKLIEAKRICSKIKGFPTETLLSSPGTSLIKTGKLQEYPISDESNKNFIVLLTKTMVVALVQDEKKKSYEYKDSYDLNGAKVKLEALDNRLVLVFTPPLDENIVIPTGDVKSIKFTLDDEEELKVWESKIENTIKECEVSKNLEDDMGESASHKKKQMVDDLVKAEVQYVHYLKGIKEFLETEMFIEEKSSKNKLVGKDSDMTMISQFFESVKPIIGSHIAILDLLFLRISEWDEKPKISDIFIDHIDNLMNRYHLYCLLWEEIKPLFIKKKNDTKTKFSQNVSDFENSQGILMEVFLEQVSQRLPVINRTLNDIINVIGEKDEDYHDLIKISKNLKEMSDKIVTLKEFTRQQEKHKTTQQSLVASNENKKKPSLVQRFSLQRIYS